MWPCSAFGVPSLSQGMALFTRRFSSALEGVVLSSWKGRGGSGLPRVRTAPIVQNEICSLLLRIKKLVILALAQRSRHGLSNLLSLCSLR